ncbi:MAG: NAD(P)/FAD-dependent oxidoreductase, partial [Porticoccus sp.]|nr:NAD(P)/FAD-dependent oxidoreductase [Porticoccus sp.]
MTQRVIIVGAGHAAAQLAPSLRKQGWEGEIAIIGDEPHAPYQRPPLSKEFMSGEKDDKEILIRPEAAYKKHGIELRLNHSVLAINLVENTLVLDNGERLAYDKLALCTGARARKINLPGSDLDGVCYLRTLDDVKNIKRYLGVNKSIAPSLRAVIVGGGYIGLETAAVLTTLGVNVTVLEMQERVLARVTALEVSEFYQRVHAEEGVSIRTNMVVSHIDGGCKDSDKYPLKAYCDNGEYFDADLVIVGVGVIPNVELAEAAGLAVENGITVDEFAFTSDTNIVA